MADDNDLNLIHLTADVVSAYVGNNPVPVSELPGLIASVNAALSGGYPRAQAAKS
ncbi:MucR family transcriptional regulator [Mesorhizobium sp. M0589]|uniref:MucR family transcriptional regulator n=1 Tax=Mesorhizobium sp. M0589 TaxID=2956965 RepID=UPI00333ABD78